ncbi:DUF2946 family protein [Parapedobacter sp. 10938]|uniref:DUF2946 family protein n=1 Tax=Parapedobacter flavus TaxID=3110225 RepID=UPI002DB9880D|nr:DUF2946 family protein [Parapedobacter sp. 10938]MEC3878852.1 DUF2946 family protein [Parapedobacter sp. 10938]
MRRYFHISRWLLCAITLSVVVTVVSIPLISALHTHVEHMDGCNGSSDTPGTDDASDCGFCALYAQFTPWEVLPVPTFSFRAPVTPLLTTFGQPRPKVLCKGLVSGHTTRGPPSFSA